MTNVELGFDSMRLGGTYWTGLLDHPGLFISDEGQVASVRYGNPRLLKGSHSGGGYRLVGYGKGRFYIHQMMCEVFHGPRPDGAHVRHLDGNRTNNDCSNVVWGTPTENAADTDRHGRHARGEQHTNAKLTREQVAWMRAERATSGTTYQRLADHCGVSIVAAYLAVKGFTWK